MRRKNTAGMPGFEVYPSALHKVILVLYKTLIPAVALGRKDDGLSQIV